MKNTKFPLPKKYLACLALLAALCIFLFANIFIVNELIEAEEFRDFLRQDWYYFSIFLLAEACVVAVAFFVAVKGSKLLGIHEKQVREYYEQFLYAGIEQGEYLCVWFDYSGEERAKIAKKEDGFYLFVEEFDYKTECWTAVNTESVFDSLEKIKKVLYDEYDFFCEETTAIDEHREDN